MGPFFKFFMWSNDFLGLRLHYVSLTSILCPSRPFSRIGGTSGMVSHLRRSVLWALVQMKNLFISEPNLLRFCSDEVYFCRLKHVGKPTLRCRHCYFVIKDEQKYVMCTAKPRHRQVRLYTTCNSGF
jgi:ribosomal protein L36